MTKKLFSRAVMVLVAVAIMLLANHFWSAMEPAVMGATLKAQASNDATTYALGRVAQTSNWPLLWLVPGCLFILALIGFTVKDIMRFLMDKGNVI